MKIDGSTVLITGGSSGIGMALAERFLAGGAEVMVTGRRADALETVKARLPALHTIVSDAGDAGQRVALAEEVTRRFPALNILINNAGIQQQLDLLQPPAWATVAQEIEINVSGPVHLSLLLAPHLARQEDAWIVNVSSGLAFAPLARVPVYCATKAALHSFTQSLRHQLAGKVGVIEVLPPAVKTNLGGSHDFGEELDVFADSIIEQLKANVQEAAFGTAKGALRASRDDLDRIFELMNSRPSP
jgi:uncharacterized oxidoreductase